ncbi:hypothetical protein EDD86DRAFT_200865 [Gorgonomyces haynaldii]|nr:hypothetical protein EDD86DRAFT_200865 [Gorgonomyces haynaldii]
MSEEFVLLAKSTRGSGCVKLINDCIEKPGVFHFTELLQQPTIQQLQNTEFDQSFKLLQLFCFGTLHDLKVQISPLQMHKLRQLTLVSLANQNAVLQYNDLLQSLQLSNIRELEDLIMDSVYSGIVKGKMDQKHSRFMVEDSISRDLQLGDLDTVKNQLEGWIENANQILETLDAQAKKITSDAQQREREKLLFSNKLKEARSDTHMDKRERQKAARR